MQTEFIEYICWERSKERKLLQISSERNMNQELKNEMNLLQNESDNIKIIYQANLKRWKVLQKKVDDALIFKDIWWLKLQFVQFHSSEILTEILDSTFIEIISVIRKASDQETQHIQEILSDLMLLNSWFIKWT